ncbi:unnamed protein product [Notodromas monacha]|uniref:Oxysterol-binding protein n=1 Tax=Notodromas monacha TaxID=399045 RepID=A0A7R9BDZ9_9CRUS|nr:unnamed protein product [Notodromas monacha]CAG0913599.1 unnamed protein product [Notodromas monacha]
MASSLVVPGPLRTENLGSMGSAVIEGPLSKWTNMMQGWQFRWFVLDDCAGLLSYYTSKEKMTRGVRRGCVRLKGAVLGIEDEDNATFTITVDGKVFHFQAASEIDKEKWVRALEDTIVRHAQSRYRLYSLTSPLPTVADFEAKMTEADAYLQLMIDQVKDLAEEVSKQSNSDTKRNLERVHTEANNMLESIKHLIVVLQIAKNAANPINGCFIPDSPSEMSGFVRPVQQGSEVAESFLDAFSSVVIGPDKVVTGIETGIECVSETVTMGVASITPIVTVPPSAQIVPETSYSSSEEEDFYDAYDDDYNVPISGITLDAKPDAQGLSPVDAELRLPSGSDFVPKNVDYDALYDDDEEEDLGSMERHGSIIMHLVSQVKIGMDLTKVVLPTFILERKSLLEMFADFFAHPDLFVSINDKPTPEARFTTALQWYLSSFHAGRKSSIAKKPYNPILGEIFRCSWTVPGVTKKETADPALKAVGPDSPVPWARGDQLTYIAEQVSHHPPISAFYAEHPGKRMSVNSHIWTKSKFLGLSIAVHMVGQGVVSLLDHNEEYIFSFPSGYGRSILTVPWMELGGTCSVHCPQTGYNATVEFLTKPFYGGKKHRITSDAFRPGEKKPYLSVKGEWNGLMTVKWADSGIITKELQPVLEQEDFESRKLWKDVTIGLKYGDIEMATKGKSFLEHRQRTEAHYRAEHNIPWNTKAACGFFAIVYFESDFQYTEKHEWMVKNWKTCFYYVGIYMILVFSGRHYMQSRRAFELRTPLVVWNLFLSIFSIIGASRTLPELFHVLTTYGFHHSACVPSFIKNNRVCGFWTWMFILSKVPELGDTVFIVLRKQRLIFLHWYHHVTVLLYTWYAFAGFVAPGRWFITMNYLVHSLMYSYYALKALKFRVPRRVSMIITAAQLMQMVVGCYVNVFAYNALERGEKCQVTVENIKVSLLMYFSYFVLFSRFFYKAYIHKGVMGKSCLKSGELPDPVKTKDE